MGKYNTQLNTVLGRKKTTKDMFESTEKAGVQNVDWKILYQ